MTAHVAEVEASRDYDAVNGGSYPNGNKCIIPRGPISELPVGLKLYDRNSVIEECAIAAWNSAMEQCLAAKVNPAERNDLFLVCTAIRALKVD